MFTANIWFTAYREGKSNKLAATIADVTGEAVHASPPPVPEAPERSSLSGRELEVLRLLVQGMANKEIAARIEVSESTVKNALQQLFARTNVRIRAQLVRVALENYRQDL